MKKYRPYIALTKSDILTLEYRTIKALNNGEIDEPLIPLITMLNKVPDIEPIWSCSSHPNEGKKRGYLAITHIESKTEDMLRLMRALNQLTFNANLNIKAFYRSLINPIRGKTELIDILKIEWGATDEEDMVMAIGTISEVISNWI